jgi:hypothetical protein
VLRLASKTIAILALCSTVGLQWLALQSVAWTTMMISNARQISFCEAMKRTFDGAHPCSLCHVVNKGKTSEQKRDIQTSGTQIDIVCVSRAIRLLPGLAQFQHTSSDARFSEIEYSPPAPPPRLVLS